MGSGEYPGVDGNTWGLGDPGIGGYTLVLGEYPDTGG